MAATVSGVLVVAAAIFVGRLLRKDDVSQESDDPTASPAIVVAVEQPCG